MTMRKTWRRVSVPPSTRSISPAARGDFLMPTRRGVLLAAPIITVAPAVGWAAQALAVDLKGVPPGPLPDSFSTARTGKGAPPVWRVQADDSVPAGRVIAQT